MAVKGGAFGADTIVVPARLVWRNQAGGAGRGGNESAREEVRCDGPGSACEGRGQRGVFVHPEDPGFKLCPTCSYALMERRSAEGGGTD